MIKIEYFAEMWQKQKKDKKATLNFWEERADYFNNLYDNPENQKRIDDLIDFFKKKEMITPESNLLDIGTGPGYFSLGLAPLVNKITGFDLSPKMISFAQKKLKEKKVNNVDFKVLDWEQADLQALNWEKNFDMVFALRCPGINSQKVIEKMSIASRKHCLISSFVNIHCPIKNALEKIILNRAETINSRFNAIYFAFNILWLSGFYPEIITYDTGWEAKYSFAETLSLYIKTFEVEKNLNTDEKEEITSYLKSITNQEGLVTEKIRGKVAWLYWQV